MKTTKDPTKKNPNGFEYPQIKYEAGLERSAVRGKHVIILDDIVYSGRTLAALKRLIEDRGAESVKTYALIDARKSNSVEIDGACLKGEFSQAYYGVGMDVLGAKGIQDGKHKLNIYSAGKRKPKARHGDAIKKTKTSEKKDVDNER